jgi:hypothetical protein
VTPTDALLADELWIFDFGEAGAVPVTKDAAQLNSRGDDAARHDQRRAAEVDEADVATLLYPPASSQVRGHAGLTSV